jgi:hypothetical protein
MTLVEAPPKISKQPRVVEGTHPAQLRGSVLMTLYAMKSRLQTDTETIDVLMRDTTNLDGFDRSMLERGWRLSRFGFATPGSHALDAASAQFHYGAEFSLEQLLPCEHRAGMSVTRLDASSTFAELALADVSAATAIVGFADERSVRLAWNNLPAAEIPAADLQRASGELAVTRMCWF